MCCLAIVPTEALFINNLLAFAKIGCFFSGAFAPDRSLPLRVLDFGSQIGCVLAAAIAARQLIRFVKETK
jgi:hypothetical protein